MKREARGGAGKWDRTVRMHRGREVGQDRTVTCAQVPGSVTCAQSAQTVRAVAGRGWAEHEFLADRYCLRALSTFITKK